MTRRPQPAPPEAATGPDGVIKLIGGPRLKAAADIEPLLRLSDVSRILNCSRRVIERLRAADKLPAADLHIGRSPRWRADTIRAWIERERERSQRR